MKHFIKTAFGADLPAELMQRRDKMGFPVPIDEWFSAELRDFVGDIFSAQASRQREFLDGRAILANFTKAERFSRKVWGLLSLELWHRLFHDRATYYRRLIDDPELCVRPKEQRVV